MVGDGYLSSLHEHDKYKSMTKVYHRNSNEKYADVVSAYS